MKQTFTSTDLKNQLWNTLSDVRRKRITPHVANSVAAQSREIMRIVKMELQVIAMSGQKPGKTMLEFSGHKTTR